MLVCTFPTMQKGKAQLPFLMHVLFHMHKHVTENLSHTVT